MVLCKYASFNFQTFKVEAISILYFLDTGCTLDLEFYLFYTNGNVLEIEQWFEGRLLCVEFWPLQWQRRRLQTLKRNFKLILSRSQPKLNHSILLEANNFPDFYLELQTHSKQVPAHHIFQFFWRFIFISFSDFLVWIWYQVHPGQYSHNIVFDKLNVHQRRWYQRPPNINILY